MQEREVNFLYEDSELESLFTKEEDVIANISPYCNSTDKVIESQYFISNTSPLFFTVEIKVIQK